MREPGSYRFWEVRRPYGVAVRVGLVTAGVILIGEPDLAYVPFIDEDNRKGILGAGLSEEVADNYTEMGAAVRTGLIIADYKKHRPQFSPTRLEDFAKEFAAAYATA
jgi:hypothetical protein